jgi:hypothetical protein
MMGNDRRALDQGQCRLDPTCAGIPHGFTQHHRSSARSSQHGAIVPGIQHDAPREAALQAAYKITRVAPGHVDQPRRSQLRGQRCIICRGPIYDHDAKGLRTQAIE